MPRDVPLERFRNIGIMAHIDAGKTTCTERVLFYSGRIHRPGEVHEATTQTDSSVDERNRGITIYAAATTVYWTPAAGSFAGVAHRVNVIDTPGHVDFTVEVERSLRVLDGGVVVLDGGNGVEPQTETVWNQAERYRVPRIAFVNKMDKVGADFAMCVDSIRERLGARPVPVQLPLGEQDEHRGVIDLLRMRAFVFDEAKLGREYTTVEIPDELRAAAQTARDAIVEACAEVDDAIMARFVDGRAADVTDVELERALRRATLEFRLLPVLCGSAFKFKGVQMLLDAIVTYLPSPADLPPVRCTGEPCTEREARDDAPFSALAFKTVGDEHGNLTYLRVYSGTLAAGASVTNSSRGRSERVGRLVRMHANKQENVGHAYTGEIVAAIGLRDTRTGDTLCDPGAPIVLESMTFPEPVVEIAVEPRTRADHDKLGLSLQKIAMEDPSFRVNTDDETGQTIIRGMGELQLAIIVDRLRRDHKVEVATGRPKVAYRETLAGGAEVRYRHAKQDGGKGQFAEVQLAIAPAARGAGLVFVNDVAGGVIPREYVPAVQKGVAGAMDRGILAGYPVVDVEVRLLDGMVHKQDSSAMAFETAGSMAFQQAARAAGIALLEPVMAVEVVTPERFVGDVIGDLNARRGQVRGIAARGARQVISALVPLGAMFGYVDSLRSRTEGRASAGMQFSHYGEVPRALHDEIVART